MALRPGDRVDVTIYCHGRVIKETAIVDKDGRYSVSFMTTSWKRDS